MSVVKNTLDVAWDAKVYGAVGTLWASLEAYYTHGQVKIL